MAHRTTRRYSCLSESSRIGAQNSQFHLCRARASCGRLHFGIVDVERPDRTWSRNLVCASRKPMESNGCRLLVRVCKSARVSIRFIALVPEAIDLVPASLADQSNSIKPVTDPP